MPTGTGVSTADPYTGINPPVTGLYGTTITGTSYQGYAVNPAPIGSVYQPGIYTGTLSVPNGTTTFASGVYILMNGISLTGNQTVNSATTGGVDGKGGVLLYVYRGSVSLAGNGGQPSVPSPRRRRLHGSALAVAGHRHLAGWEERSGRWRPRGHPAAESDRERSWDYPRGNCICPGCHRWWRWQRKSFGGRRHCRVISCDGNDAISIVG